MALWNFSIFMIVSCLMFDGRRDKTKIIREVQNLENNQEIKCTEVEEPGSNYIDHLIPQ